MYQFNGIDTFELLAWLGVLIFTYLILSWLAGIATGIYSANRMVNVSAGPLVIAGIVALVTQLVCRGTEATAANFWHGTKRRSDGTDRDPVDLAFRDSLHRQQDSVGHFLRARALQFFRAGIQDDCKVVPGGIQG